MISNCGSDEYGGASGGKAGDQTGNEYRVRTWYDGNWTAIFRHHNDQVRNLIARKAIQAANNDLIGYDQSQRTTFWQHLKASNYDPSQITIACEADCSSSTAAIAKAVGIVLGIQKLADIDINMSTWVEVEELTNAGFQMLTATKYLTSERNLIPGDILLKYGHTCIEVGSGNVNDFPEDDMPSVQDVWNYDGAMGKVNEINARAGSIENKSSEINEKLSQVDARLSEVLSRVTIPLPQLISSDIVFRLYNPYSDDHLFTASAGERNELIANGWKDEGNAWTMPQVPLIHRLYNPYTSDHMLTIDQAEAQSLINDGWRYEGVAGVSSADGAPVYRLSNPYTNDHVFTADEDEVKQLIAGGWNDEGVAFRTA